MTMKGSIYFLLAVALLTSCVGGARDTGADKTVVDMFLLLPDDALNGQYPGEMRELMVRHEGKYVKKNDDGEYTVSIGDVPFEFYGYELRRDFNKENVLYLYGKRHYFAEAYIYLWQYDGKQLVSTIQDDGVHSGVLTAYWYKRGKLVKDEEFYAPLNAKLQLKASDFFDLDEVSKRFFRTLNLSLNGSFFRLYV